MDSIRVGRVLMTLATLIYGVIPPIVDLSETHVFHAGWTPHARMHMVWLVGTNTAVALVALHQLWLDQADRARGTRLAGVLGLCVYGGFWLSAFTLSLYGGALSEPGGVPPVMGLDANVLGFGFGLLLLLAGWTLAARRRTLAMTGT